MTLPPMPSAFDVRYDRYGNPETLADWADNNSKAVSWLQENFQEIFRRMKPTMWVVFWTLCGPTRSFRDHFEICDTEEEAQTKLKDLIASNDNLHCAGIAPIFNSTEHWHTGGHI